MRSDLLQLTLVLLLNFSLLSFQLIIFCGQSLNILVGRIYQRVKLIINSGDCISNSLDIVSGMLTSHHALSTDSSIGGEVIVTDKLLRMLLADLVLEHVRLLRSFKLLLSSNRSHIRLTRSISITWTLPGLLLSLFCLLLSSLLPVLSCHMFILLSPRYCLSRLESPFETLRT